MTGTANLHCVCDTTMPRQPRQPYTVLQSILTTLELICLHGPKRVWGPLGYRRLMPSLMMASSGPSPSRRRRPSGRGPICPASNVPQVMHGTGCTHAHLTPATPQPTADRHASLEQDVPQANGPVQRCWFWQAT